MRFLSVCSGIEAASCAWEPLGWKAHAFSEIEAFPSAVLAHHYSDTPNWGDMTKFQEWPDADVDVLVGGTPCQSFSVAGLRKGMADPRGNLALTFLAIAARYAPRWILWENVPGVLSSEQGRDFGAFLGGLAECGYGWAYRVLDAQYFGVPQRRRRVFVVGYLGDWRRAAAVLFERHSLSGHHPPRREKGQGFAADVVPSLAASGRGVERTGESRGQDPVIAVMSSGQANAENRDDGAAPTLTCPHEAPIVAHTLRAEGHDASEDGTGRGVPLVPVAIQERAVIENPDNGPQGAGFREDGQAYTLEARNKVQAVCFAQNTRDEVRKVGGDGQIAGALAAEPGMKQQNYIAFTTTGNRGAFETGDQVGTLDTNTDPNSRVVCFSAKDHGAAASEECSPTLRAGGHADSHANGGVMPAVAFAQNQRDELREMGVAGALAAKPGMKQQTFIAQSAARRLTPRECERLQGFPDDRNCVTIGVCRSEDERREIARFVGRDSTALSPDQSAPVAVDVQIDLERQVLHLRSLAKSPLSVSNAGDKSWCHLHMPQGDFVRLAALMTRTLARATQAGAAASLRNIKGSSAPLNGSAYVLLCGREIERLAADAEVFTTVAGLCMKSTTLGVGPTSPTYEHDLEILSSCVAAAISGFIPSGIQSAVLYELRVETVGGYTAVPYRNKPAADGPRYKALGNSMAVPCMVWLGERIGQVEAIAAESLAA